MSQSQLSQFLEKRGLASEKIQKLEDEKIDQDNVTCITDETLAQFIPKLGDRIAVRQEFSETSSDRNKNSVITKKADLYSKLRTKMMMGENSDKKEEDKKEKPRVGNKYAAKNTRSVEFSWKHNGVKKRKSKGFSGSKVTQLSKLTTKHQLVELATGYFFPAGQSKHGHLENMIIDIEDQDGLPIKETHTVADLSDTVEREHIKLYLSTYDKLHQTAEDKTPNTNQDAACPGPVGDVSLSQDQAKLPKTGIDVLNKRRDVTDDNGNTANCHDEACLGSAGTSSVHKSSQSQLTSIDKQDGMNENNPDLAKASSSASSDMTYFDHVTSASVGAFAREIMTSSIPLDESPEDPENFIQDMAYETPEVKDVISLDLNVAVEVKSGGQDAGEEIPPMVSRRHTELRNIPPEDTDAFVLKINRNFIVKEMMSYFKDDDIVKSKIKIEFKNEQGQDVHGVSREAYCLFWQTFMMNNAEGENYRVPILDPDFGKEEWQAVGRILLKGLQDLSYFPVSLAPAFFAALVHGEHSVTDDILKDSFCQYVTPDERDAIHAATANEKYNTDDFTSVLDRAQCHRIPQPHEMNECIIQIAHKELIQEPSYALESMRSSVQVQLENFFPDQNAIFSLYEQIQPSVTKFIALLAVEEDKIATADEEKALTFLKRFIRGRTPKELRRLLRLLTGSDVICVQKIEVTFINNQNRNLRRPIIHTCGPLLELPSTYIHYPDFRSEWENILGNERSFEMTLA